MSVFILNSVNCQIPAVAAIEAGKDNAAAIKSSAQNLKTRIPYYDERKPPKYVIELHATQTERPIGSEPLQKVDVPLERIKSDAQEPIGKDEDTGVLLEEPALTSLIKLEDDLSPLALDAKYCERVGLRETVDAALGQNLDIESSYATMQSRKYALLSKASEFLPSLNSGYTLFGVKGSLPAGLLGGGAAAGGGSVKLPGAINLLNTGFTYYGYQGGKVWFGTLEQRHRFRAAKAALKGNINDIMLSAARRHYELLLNEALLSIRTRAVSISQEQLRLNTVQEKAGAATGLDVLQSEAQLASDEQNLIDQQNARRQSAIQLAHVLNISFAQDLQSRERHLHKRRLIPQSAKIDQLLKVAIDHRPELKQYEELRLAAKRAIVVAAAPLQPNVSFAGSIFGISTGTKELTPIYTLNFGVKWNLGGLGTTDLANIQKARSDARQAAVQAKQQFLTVFEEVRSSYDDSLAADKRIDRASVQIRAAEEELRIAKKRMEAGIGLNIDVLNAQRDLTQASINKARAVVDFNVAQAQLLRDTGIITVDGLLTGTTIQ